MNELYWTIFAIISLTMIVIAAWLAQLCRKGYASQQDTEWRRAGYKPK